MKLSDIIPPQGKLGSDLPNTEEEMFEIDHYPLFDMELGVDILGDKAIVEEIHKDFVNTNKKDLEAIKESYKKSDWEKIEALVHKLKGGASFGTIRLFFALLFLERYLKAGHTKVKDALYFQMFKVFDKTVNDLKEKGLLQ